MVSLLFQTPEFFFLLIISALLYWMLPQGRLLILGIASAIFYGWAGTGYLALFFLMAAATYLCSWRLEATGKRGWFLFGLFLNLGNLIFFKYALFLLREITGLTGLVLVPPGSIMGQLVLPVGISFYTFQLMAYLTDVYRGEIKVPGFLRFWVFISFFAQLIAGPIMRGRDFLPQIEKIEKITFDKDLTAIKWGIFWITLGLVKKVVLADTISPLVDWHFDRAAWIYGFQSWLGAYLFGFQIYLDFSGYSDMAIGLGKLFGLAMTRNFHTPYLSLNPSEFWRRWHVTLSSWVRDYIYIPLGGSRRGEAKRSRNLILAMTICGFWHGAAWTYLFWGFYHGVVLVLYHQFQRHSRKREFKNIPPILTVFLTFQVITIGWVFFRAETLTEAWIYLSHMFQNFNIYQLIFNKKALFPVLLLFLFHLWEDRFLKNHPHWAERWRKLPAPIRGLGYFLIMVLILAYLTQGQQSFIYFRF